MSRPAAEEKIQDYLDGRMTPDERVAFESSLKRDPELAARVEEYRGIGDALREPDGSLSPEFFARTRLRFEEQTRARTAPRWFRMLSWETAGLVVAAGLAAVLFVPYLWQEEPSPYENPPIPDRQVVLAAPPAQADRDDAPKESAPEKLLEERLEQAAAPAAAATQPSENKGRWAALRAEAVLEDEAADPQFPVSALAEGVVPPGEVRVVSEELAKRKRDHAAPDGFAKSAGEPGWRRVLIGAGPRPLDCATLTVTHTPDGWRVRIEESEAGSPGCEVRLPESGGPVEVERITPDGQ